MFEKAALVFGQMDEPPGVRLRVALSALTMAEYFRDVQNQDVLLFRRQHLPLRAAGSEVSTLLAACPRPWLPPTLADEMGQLQERITSTRGRSITSLQAVYVPADDYTDPAPFTTFTFLDATTELSRQIASLASTRPWTRWPRPRRSCRPRSSVTATTPSPDAVQRSSSATRSCRTSSPSSVSTSSPRRTASRWPVPASAALPVAPFYVAEVFHRCVR